MSDQILSTKDSSGNEGSQLNIVFRLRMSAFFRLKMFDELLHEASTVLAFEEQQAHVLLQGIERPKQGLFFSDKVLALQLLLIETRTMTGRGEEALQQLYSLRNWLCDNLSPNNNDQLLWWKWRVQWSIINTLSKQRQWRQTIYELQTILRDVQWKRSNLSAPQHGIHSHASLLSSEILVLCRMSRTLLQVIDFAHYIYFSSDWCNQLCFYLC